MTAAGAFVPPSHRAVRLLWKRVVAVHRAGVRSGAGEFGMGYAMGFRDGLSEAYCAVTGMSRQAVGDKARMEAAQQPPISDLGSADVTTSPPSAEPGTKESV